MQFGQKCYSIIFCPISFCKNVGLWAIIHQRVTCSYHLPVNILVIILRRTTPSWPSAEVKKPLIPWSYQHQYSLVYFMFTIQEYWESRIHSKAVRCKDGVRLLKYEIRVDLILNQQWDGESVSLTVTQKTILLLLAKAALFVAPCWFVNIVAVEPLRLSFVINSQVVCMCCDEQL